MRLGYLVVITSAALLVLSCGGQGTGFGPYPSITAPTGAGIASFGAGGSAGAQANATAAAAMAGLGCGPVGPDQIGIVVFNFDDITNQYPSIGQTGPGAVAHTVVISESGQKPASLGTLTVPACQAQCLVVPCVQSDVIIVEDEKEKTSSPPSDTSFQAAYTKFQMCGISGACSVNLNCGQIAVVLIERKPNTGGVEGPEPWGIWYRTGGSGVTSRPVTGCPTDLAMQIMAQLPYAGLASP